ncbi:MAG TPA: hypothetical protein DHV36_15265 [Desulfobacteraceae bacterium]|nr:hypothetical protein [Desulfobacteraceae bacterium]|tara:strand:+ start:108 stop:638 length:531 start_codon:yes stop_codon:yes gene_type:complete
MKTIKFLFFLIILGFLGLLGYQNQDYFLATTALNIDLKVKSIHYTAYPLPNYAYWGICFAIAFLYMAFKGMIKSFKLGREIKRRDSKIDTLNGKITDLQERLDVFIHDPYIKNALAKNEAKEAGDTTDETKAQERTPDEAIPEALETETPALDKTAEEDIVTEDAAPEETPEKKGV